MESEPLLDPFSFPEGLTIDLDEIFGHKSKNTKNNVQVQQQINNPNDPTNPDTLDQNGNPTFIGNNNPDQGIQDEVREGNFELTSFANTFTQAYSSFYEVLYTNTYVETRNWQVNMPTSPRTTNTIQFWMSSEHINYKWRSLFSARGGFLLSIEYTMASNVNSLGSDAFQKEQMRLRIEREQSIGGTSHALSDLSTFEDMFFHLYGSYEFPISSEMIITVNNIPGANWPLRESTISPPQSTSSPISNLYSNGQLGFGYYSHIR